MEPSRRNQWQSAANRPAAETAEQAKSVAVGCDWLPRDGKEGVDGSSPSEGFGFLPAQLMLLLSWLAPAAGVGVHAASTMAVVRHSARRVNAFGLDHAAHVCVVRLAIRQRDCKG
jgi:hypothetical protein